jgi:hypothetical protein
MKRKEEEASSSSSSSSLRDVKTDILHVKKRIKKHEKRLSVLHDELRENHKKHMQLATK